MLNDKHNNEISILNKTIKEQLKSITELEITITGLKKKLIKLDNKLYNGSKSLHIKNKENCIKKTIYIQDDKGNT